MVRYGGTEFVELGWGWEWAGGGKWGLRKGREGRLEGAGLEVEGAQPGVGNGGVRGWGVGCKDQS